MLPYSTRRHILDSRSASHVFSTPSAAKIVPKIVIRKAVLRRFVSSSDDAGCWWCCWCWCCLCPAPVPSHKLQSESLEKKPPTQPTPERNSASASASIAEVSATFWLLKIVKFMHLIIWFVSCCWCNLFAQNLSALKLCDNWLCLKSGLTPSHCEALCQKVI